MSLYSPIYSPKVCKIFTNSSRDPIKLSYLLGLLHEETRHSPITIKQIMEIITADKYLQLQFGSISSVRRLMKQFVQHLKFVDHVQPKSGKKHRYRVSIPDMYLEVIQDLKRSSAELLEVLYGQVTSGNIRVARTGTRFLSLLQMVSKCQVVRNIHIIHVSIDNNAIDLGTLSSMRNDFYGNDYYTVRDFLQSSSAYNKQSNTVALDYAKYLEVYSIIIELFALIN